MDRRRRPVHSLPLLDHAKGEEKTRPRPHATRRLPAKAAKALTTPAKLHWTAEPMQPVQAICQGLSHEKEQARLATPPPKMNRRIHRAIAVASVKEVEVRRQVDPLEQLPEIHPLDVVAVRTKIHLGLEESVIAMLVMTRPGRGSGSGNVKEAETGTETGIGTGTGTIVVALTFAGQHRIDTRQIARENVNVTATASGIETVDAMAGQVKEMGEIRGMPWQRRRTAVAIHGAWSRLLVLLLQLGNQRALTRLLQERTSADDWTVVERPHPSVQRRLLVAEKIVIETAIGLFLLDLVVGKIDKSRLPRLRRIAHVMRIRLLLVLAVIATVSMTIVEHLHLRLLLKPALAGVVR